MLLKYLFGLHKKCVYNVNYFDNDATCNKSKWSTASKHTKRDQTIKIADDSVRVGRIPGNNESMYKEDRKRIDACCRNATLFNAGKTTELIIDLLSLQNKDIDLSRALRRAMFKIPLLLNL